MSPVAFQVNICGVTDIAGKSTMKQKIRMWKQNPQSFDFISYTSE